MTKTEQFRNDEYVVREIHSESFLVETIINDEIDDNKDRYFSTLDQAMDFVSSDNIQPEGSPPLSYLNQKEVIL